MATLASAERLTWLTRLSSVGVAWPTIGVAVVSFTGFVALGIAAAVGAVPWAISIPVQAALAFAGFTPVHDASHGSVARARWVNELVGWPCGLPILAPFGGFRYLHYAHHAFTNDRDRDPDMWSGKARTRIGIALRWTVMDLHYLVRYLTELTTRPRGEVVASAAGVTAMWTSWVVLIATGHGIALVIGWLVPARLAILTLSIVFDWIPHHPRAATGAEDPYRATNAYEDRWLAAPLLGQNYHLIHHLYPGVPFYRYGRVYWAMRDELLARGADLRRIGRRLAIPAVSASPMLAIAEVIDETADTKTFRFAGALPYRAGQFVVVHVPLPGGTVRRCYSLSRCPEAEELAITVKRQGRASRWLHEHARVGTALRVDPAAGQFVLAPDATRPLALVAAGSGITPVIAIAESALRSTVRRVKLIYANRDADSVIFAARLAALAAAYPRFELVPHLDSEHGYLAPADLARLLASDLDVRNIDASTVRGIEAGTMRGVVRGLDAGTVRGIDASVRGLDAAAGAGIDIDLYACGPERFMDVVEHAADRLAIPRVQRFSERFAPRARPLDTATPRATGFVAIHRGERREIAVRAGETLLAAARRAGLEPRASCESGYCGTCTAHLQCGRVTARATGPLGDGDLARGFVLPCSAFALAGPAVVVDFDATPERQP